jgi:hypothetical protein
MMQRGAQQITRRMLSRADGSHIPKDLKGKSETEIKRWLAEQQKQSKPISSEMQKLLDNQKLAPQPPSKIKSKSLKSDSDLCTIL